MGRDMDIRHSDNQRRAETSGIRATLAQSVTRFLGDRDEKMSPFPGLSFGRVTERKPPSSFIYEPSIAIIFQGSKRVSLADTTYVYDESRFLLTAVNLPTVTEVLAASPQTPYLSALMRIDLQVARDLIRDVDSSGQGMEPDPNQTAIAIGPATFELFDAIARIMALFDSSRDLAHIGPLIQKEMLYRVLVSPVGRKFRETVLAGTTSNRVAKAIEWLKENFRSPLTVDELADISGMGVSTLYHHFQAMTSMSPLQYQKHLRLHEARRMLLVDDIDAATAAIQVGYESPSQFSREYRRMFGAPPIKDVKTLKASVV